MEQRVSLITLGVADVAVARAFYEKLGWRVGLDIEETVFFQIGDSILTLWAGTSWQRTAASSMRADGAA